MCGRFTLTADMNELQAAFPWVEIPPEMQPRYNITPSQPVGSVPNDGKNKLDFFVWGLIPSWAKDPTIGNRMINARAETMAQKPSFRSAFHRRRCLILADGFYEWRKDNGKTPYYIHLESRQPFAFAGLWDTWQSKDGSEIRSCTIITTSPNELMATIHNRMPVILPAEAYPIWLDPQNQDTRQLTDMLAPYPAAQMAAYPVSKTVNNPKTDLPACILPL